MSYELQLDTKTFNRASLVQLVERKTCNFEVKGSNPL